MTRRTDDDVFGPGIPRTVYLAGKSHAIAKLRTGTRAHDILVGERRQSRCRPLVSKNKPFRETWRSNKQIDEIVSSYIARSNTKSKLSSPRRWIVDSIGWAIDSAQTI